ncbi:MAG: DUF2071 domain-containing protein [Anaerolineae bacterium]|nr:DUF2071 domain-containing protein [Anaerolineae bacterium]
MQIKSQIAHRPWPMPMRPWVMAQSWCHLLFAHWPLPPHIIARLLPSGLAVDTFDGQAWVGVVPFEIVDFRARALPPLPPLRRFVELNVRTYVIRDGKPGVWFFSLDANHRLAVEGARIGFSLPYFMAKMRCEVDGDRVQYADQRIDRRSSDGVFQSHYRPVSPVYRSEPGTLDHWLTERYCLYAASMNNTLYRAEIHHAPWPLQQAEAEIQINTVTKAHGIWLPRIEPLLHYVHRIDMIGWTPEKVKTPTP